VSSVTFPLLLLHKGVNSRMVKVIVFLSKPNYENFKP